jgi:phytoene desaturase
LAFENEAVIVGAGIAGLVTACYLSRAGWKITLLEANPTAGGKMAQLDLGPHPLTGLARVWDTGPTLVTLAPFIDQVFSEILPSDLAKPTFLPVKQGADLYFESDLRVTLPASGQNFYTEISQILSPKSCEELRSVLRIASDVFKFAQTSVLNVEPQNLLSLGLKTLTSGIALKYPFLASQSYESFVRSNLSDPNLQELFLHFASYVGIMPHCAASALVSIAHVEMTEEVVFPRGGVFEISKVLQQCAQKLGVQFLPNAEVADAQMQSVGNWRVSLKKDGESSSGESFLTKNLVVATDPHQALVNWLKSEPLLRSWYQDIDKKVLRPSESQFVILFERSESAPLAHHSKIFPKSWLESYRQTVEQGQIPLDPCVYLVWPHATDPSICSSVLFVSAMAPNLGSGHHWNDELCLNYAETIMKKVRQRLGMGLPGRVMKTVSPLDLFRNTGSLMGGLYGAAPTQYTPGFFARPGKSKVPGLSFVGGGVHPGAGVPMVMMGARRVAQRLISQGRGS